MVAQVSVPRRELGEAELPGGHLGHQRRDGGKGWEGLKSCKDKNWERVLDSPRARRGGPWHGRRIVWCPPEDPGLGVLWLGAKQNYA